MIPRTTTRRRSKPAPIDVMPPPRDDAGWSQIRSSEEEGEPVATPPGVRDGATRAGPGSQRPDGEDRERMIREAAYLRFIARGCEDGHAVDDWLAAEAEMARLFSPDTPHSLHPGQSDDGVPG